MPELVIPAPLWRRLAAATYDSLLMLALYVAVLFADEIVRDSLLRLPVNYGALRVLALLVWFAFFGWCWTHGGQTLGMRSWRLRVQRSDGSALNWPTAALRYAVAWLSWGMLGLGMLWCLVDRNRRSWHDLVAGTEVVVLPREVSASVSAGPPPAH